MMRRRCREASKELGWLRNRKGGGEGMTLGLWGGKCPVGGEVTGGLKGLEIRVAPDDLSVFHFIKIAFVLFIDFWEKRGSDWAHL